MLPSGNFFVLGLVVRLGSEAKPLRVKKEPGPDCSGPGIYLATTYSHRTCRPTTIGAAAFHFRVRNGTGWFHRALVTRGQCQWQGAGAALLLELNLWGPEHSGFEISNLKFQIAGLPAGGPLADIHTEIGCFPDRAGSRPFTVL